MNKILQILLVLSLVSICVVEGKRRRNRRAAACGDAPNLLSKEACEKATEGTAKCAFTAAVDGGAAAVCAVAKAQQRRNRRQGKCADAANLLSKEACEKATEGTAKCAFTAAVDGGAAATCAVAKVQRRTRRSRKI